MSIRGVKIAFVGETAALERAVARAAELSAVAADKIGMDFDRGTSKAAAGLERLAKAGESFGVPFATSVHKVSGVMDDATSKSKKFGDSLAATGKMALQIGAVGFGAASYEALKFGSSMQTVQATLQGTAGISAAAAKKIGDAFLNTMGTTTYTGEQLTSAYASVAAQLQLTEGHVLSAAEAVQFMHQSTELAHASGESLNTTTAVLARTMQAYHLSLGQAAGTTDILFNISRSLNEPMSQVGTAIDRLHSRLGILTPSLKDVGALMLELGAQGVTGMRSIMAVNSGLQTLISPSKKVNELLKTLGVSLYTSSGQFIGIGGVIQQLQPKLEGLTQKEKLFVEQTLFGKSAAQILGNVVQAGVGAYDRASTAVSKTGSAHAAAEAQMKTFSHQMEMLKATVIDLATKFGEFLIPKVEALAHVLADGINWLEKHKTAASMLASVIANVLGVAIAAYAYQKAQAFIAATKAMADGIGKLALKVAAAVSGMMAKFSSLGPEAQAAAAEVSAADEEMAASTEASATAIDTALASTGVGAVLVGLGIAAGVLMTHWDNVMSAMKTAVQDMVSAATKALNGLITALNAAISVFNSTIGQLTGTIGAIGNVSNPNLFGSGGVGSTLVNTPGGGIGSGVPSGLTLGKGAAWQQIAAALAGQGFSRVAIAGILGNFGQESGGQTITGINPSLNGASGLGIAQWMGSRRANEAAFAAIHHESPTSLQAEIGYLISELRNGYHNAFNAIQHASSPSQAAQLFEQLFEGAGTPNMPARISLANQAYAMLGAPGSAPGGTVGATGNPAIDKLLNAAINGKHKKKALKAIRSLLYANPFAGDTGVTQERTDEGVDFSAPAGSRIGAVGAGKIVDIVSNWFKGQPLIEEQLTSGPDAGKFVYYAEQLNALVHQGQTVQAGQTIGRVAARGTGLELGFGANPRIHPGDPTLAMATTGYTEGQVTPAGQAFAQFLRSIGGGKYITTKGGVVTSSLGAGIGPSIAALIQKYMAGLTKAADTLIQDYGNLEQSGTPRTLEKALGVTTGGKSPISGAIAALVAGTRFHGHKETHERILGMLGTSAEKSMQGAQFTSLIARLVATHQKGMLDLARQLVAAHTQALKTLLTEMLSVATTKKADEIQLTATQLKDVTTLQANHAAAMLKIANDRSAQIVDAWQAAAKQIDDMTQSIKDAFASAAQAIQNATQIMADTSAGQVQAIQDGAQATVDKLAERGLYGLNLKAQQEQVALDLLKQQYDAQINAAQLNLDQVKAITDAKVALAQQTADLVQTQQDSAVAAAQARADAVTLGQDIKLAASQAHVDSVTQTQDINVQLAQTAVDLSANASKAQQDMAAAQLKHAQAVSSLAIDQAGKAYSQAQSAANKAIGAAQANLAQVQAVATAAESGAQQKLAMAQGEASILVAQAQGALQTVQDNAAQQEATLQGIIDITKEQASTQFAGTGTVVNIYGIPTSNAAAIGDAVDWVARTQLQVPA